MQKERKMTSFRRFRACPVLCTHPYRNHGTFSIVLYILITIQRIRDKYTIPWSGLGNPVISAAIRGRWSSGKLQGRIPRCLVNVIANHYRWSSLAVKQRESWEKISTEGKRRYIKDRREKEQGRCVG